jgi:hypothetical protein
MGFQPRKSKWKVALWPENASTFDLDQANSLILNNSEA